MRLKSASRLRPPTLLPLQRPPARPTQRALTGICAFSMAATGEPPSSPSSTIGSTNDRWLDTQMGAACLWTSLPLTDTQWMEATNIASRSSGWMGHMRAVRHVASGFWRSSRRSPIVPNHASVDTVTRMMTNNTSRIGISTTPQIAVLQREAAGRTQGGEPSRASAGDTALRTSSAGRGAGLTRGWPALTSDATG